MKKDPNHDHSMVYISNLNYNNLNPGQSKLFANLIRPQAFFPLKSGRKDLQYKSDRNALL